MTQEKKDELLAELNADIVQLESAIEKQKIIIEAVTAKPVGEAPAEAPVEAPGEAPAAPEPEPIVEK